AFNKKTVSARQSRRTSQRLQESTIGTHVQRRPTRTHAQTGADSVSFSNARRQARAESGQVSTIVPNTSSREDASAYRSRVSRMRYVETVQRSHRRRRIMGFALVALAIVAIGVIAGVIAFMGNLGSKTALTNSDAETALSAPKTGEPTYTLMSIELGSVSVPLDNGGPDILMLVREDASNGNLALVNIPGNLRVTGDDNRHHRISEYASRGDAALIEAVEKFAQVDVSHLVKVDEKGVAGIVDALGGIDFELTQEVDDPNAGDIYLPVGSHTLTGEASLVLLRAQNLSFGQHDQLSLQLDFTARLLEKLFSTAGSIGFAARLDSIDEFFQTDLSGNDMVGLANRHSGVKASEILQASVPGFTSSETNEVTGVNVLFVSKAADMESLMKQVSDGKIEPTASELDTSSVDPSSFTIEIQNGASIVGAAAATAQTLTSHGFNVEEVGNAEQSVYTETLVVYKGDQGKLRAQSIINVIGLGRAVDGSAFYEFETDILLILGADFRPIS
ncbi:MAG: LCP family protein, partial [Eggerthellaceae bacterium]|nr:LCP family protein [Eggerthellaceae bacterium]